jgi:hypothetical protein
VPELAITVYHTCCGFTGRPAYGYPTVALCSRDALAKEKGSFPENFNIKIFAFPSTDGLSFGIIREVGFAWLGMLGVGVSWRQVGRPMNGALLFSKALFIWSLSEVLPPWL